MIKWFVIPALLMIAHATVAQTGRERISFNDGWKFYRYSEDSLIYDVRPEIQQYNDDRPADARPTEKTEIRSSRLVLKPWILPGSNKFIKDRSKWFKRPEGDPGSDFPFVQRDFNDKSWETVDLPHDWAIKGPFYKGNNVPVGGGMGRLPVQGVAWYRKTFDVPLTDKGRTVFLEVEGAMSYAMVWLNGHLVGGWPYGYNSWQIDCTPYIIAGAANQIAIRLDNPTNSSRWYPGAGIYRNVWLIKTNPVHVGQWGTFITTRNVSKKAATIECRVSIENTTENTSVSTDIFLLNDKEKKAVAQIAPVKVNTTEVSGTVTIQDPRLWGPPPTQKPNRYLAVTKVFVNNKVVDTYETSFGIRDIQFDPEKGLLVNGEKIIIKGVNQHHDLGALGAAFNVQAAERQLEILSEMGCNAIRMAHNPPAPELLALTDSMGFLVIDEIFDNWALKKTPLDFHLIFSDWHEQDLRAFIRRDRNHPSVIAWSFGNEVGEQYTDSPGAALAKELYNIVKEEDPARPATVSMNYAKPGMPLPQVTDIISLNYQGEGIRNDGAYKGLKGINTPPLFPAFHEKFPGKLILSSENASAFSSRGVYLFPVFEGRSAPAKDGLGGDSKSRQVSSYELHSADFGSSADKVFATMDMHPYVAGGFVWSGWDYLGEPTPYYSSRSSYCGIIDLAGFKKDRFYLYQSYWRPELPMAHILPHWNWPGREGQITPVHVFTSGDEAELFLNGRSLGRKKKAAFEYRLRWDDVKYEPGQLKVIAYKNGKKWAEDKVVTTGKAYQLKLIADRTGSFITVQVTDKNGVVVPQANDTIQFSIEGPGEIVATDNGDATDLTAFPSTKRAAFNGLALVIIRSARPAEGTQPGGMIRVRATANKLKEATLTVH